MPTIEETNTRRPQRFFSIPRVARLVTRKAPVRFASSTRVNCSSLIRSSKVSSVIPALDTRISTGPCVSSISVNAASTCCASVTSHLTPRRPSGVSDPRCVTATLSP
jgi:hypothetical protein